MIKAFDKGNPENDTRYTVMLYDDISGYLWAGSYSTKIKDRDCSINSGRGMAQDLSLKEQKQILTDNRDFIVDNLDPDDVIDELIQDHLIGENAAQKVTQPMGWSREEKNRIIIDQLSISGPGAVKKFCEIIRRKKKANIHCRETREM